MPVFIDMHCHPTLKHYLFGYSVFREPFGRKDNDYANISVTAPAMSSGNVQVVMAAHHLPERDIVHDWRLVIFSLPLLGPFIKQYIKKVEKDDPYAQTLAMIADFELLFAGQSTAVIAHTRTELSAALAAGQKVFIHTLEGGHQLGRGETTDEYKHRIDDLKEKGVAMITLSHFYPNDITAPCEGMPPNTKKLLGMNYIPPEKTPLTPAGRAIVANMLDSGIIIDLTHTNPQARQEIFELNKGRGASARPLVFSHVGVRALFDDPQHPSFGLMAPDDDEIREIGNCRGVIGIIFMNYWLTGRDERFLSGRDFGFDYIISTIKHIAEVTGSFSNIAIGSDFDGMTDPPDDFYQTSMFGAFAGRLAQPGVLPGATAADIDNITGGNLLRVLEEGWMS
jgi:microsomal dipeptidase-like Zn-dependent dipeptidase